MADPNPVLEQWYRYEEIAMHFNTLIMQFRLQLLGGVGLIGTLASYLIGGKVKNEFQRHRLRFLVSAGLLVLVGAAAALDLFYYDRLLNGAVDALLAFERQHPEIQLSTMIENRVGWGKYAAFVSYGAVLLALLVYSVAALQSYLRDRRTGRPRPAKSRRAPAAD